MELQTTSPVGHIAAEYPLATRVFHRHGIDFCCGGGAPLDQACEKVGLSAGNILEEIQKECSDSTENSETWAEAALPELIDHIIEAYHKPLYEELPRLLEMAVKVNSVHGEKDPENLGGIEKTLTALKEELESHMQKEEQILFPMVREGQGQMADGPISVMEHEHEDAGEALRQLRAFTNDFVVPEAACNTWIALWKGLEDFEKEMHMHIHLENNILFPRSLNG